MTLPGAVDRDGDDVHLGAFRSRECAAEKLADLSGRVEGAFRKEHQGLAGGRELPYAPGVGAALVPVEALDELGAEAPQQEARQRHAHHLLLDNEGKFGGQSRHGHDPVDVAGMVGHHHARDAR